MPTSKSTKFVDVERTLAKVFESGITPSNCHYYISIQNPTVTSDSAWIFYFKPTKNHKDIFFFVNVATHVG